MLKRDPKSGIYVADFRDQFGKRQRISLKTKDKTTAEQVYATMYKDVVFGKFGLATRKALTFGDAFRQLYNIHWKQTKDAVGVWQKYESVSEYLDPTLDVSQVDSEIIDEVVEELFADGNSPATVNRKLSVISMVLTYAEDRGSIDRLPKIRRYKEAPSRDNPVPEAARFSMVQAMLDKGWTEEAELVEFLYQTGCRLSEPLKMKWQEVDLDRGVVKLLDTKANIHVYKPLSPVAIGILESKADRGFKTPFCGLTRHRMKYCWTKVRDELGFTYRIHDLRHAAATELAISGIDLRQVQAFMGHKSFKTTQRYEHLKPEHLLQLRSHLGQRTVDKTLTKSCPTHSLSTGLSTKDQSDNPLITKGRGGRVVECAGLEIRKKPL